MADISRWLRRRGVVLIGAALSLTLMVMPSAEASHKQYCGHGKKADQHPSFGGPTYRSTYVSGEDRSDGHYHHYKEEVLTNNGWKPQGNHTNKCKH